MQQTALFEILYRDIRKTVRRDIQNASNSILAAVAWFTDDHIFSELILAAQRGVLVEIIIMDDDINKNSGLFFEKLEEAGVKVWFFNVQDQTMHLKMCMIDREVLHSGSYNWTRKAATKNREVLTRMFISSDLVASQYSDEFELIKSVCYRKYAIESPPERSGNSTVNNQEPTPFNYDGTTLPSLTGVILALRFQISLLELEVASLETEKQIRLSLMETFERRLRILLSDLLSRQLELQKIFAGLKAKLTGKSKDEEAFREKERNFSAFRQQLANDANIPDDNLALDQDIKKIYREAVLMAHPDRYRHDPAKEAEATRIMSALADAFHKKDYDQVRAIHEALMNGTAFKIDWKSESDISLLQKVLANLTASRDRLLDELDNISERDTWVEMQRNPDVEVYAEMMKTRLELNIQILENEIKNYSK
jgi:hypothetical protein